MWAEYYKELWNRDTIETESGFICYQIQDETCHIVDLYVRPEKRKGIEAFKLIDTVCDLAKNIYKCKSLVGSVHLESRGSEYALATNLKYGMHLVGAENNRIFLRKDLSHGR